MLCSYPSGVVAMPLALGGRAKLLVNMFMWRSILATPIAMQTNTFEGTACHFPSGYYKRWLSLYINRNIFLFDISCYNSFEILRQLSAGDEICLIDKLTSAK